jgi:hypothetical protein
MEPREEEKRQPEAPDVRQEQPRLKRFRIIKLEERIAPLASGPGYVGESRGSIQPPCR